MGIGAVGSRRQIHKRIAELLGDPSHMDKLLRGAPDMIEDLLAMVAEQGPQFTIDIGLALMYQLPKNRLPPEHLAIQWAQEHGLIWLIGYDGTFEMPREVGLALRGPDYRVLFSPVQPEVPTVPADPEGREHESASAALRVLDQFAAALNAARATPVALLKAGGVGVRELRRVAVAARCSEDEVRLYLELAEQAAMLDVTRNGKTVRPTEAFTRWQRQSPAERLGALQTAWWGMAAAPLRDTGGGKRRVPLTHDDFGLSSRDIRQAVLRLLAELPPDVAPAGPSALSAAIGWRCVAVDEDVRDSEVEAALAEAARLGLAAGTGITDVGRTLAGAGQSGVVEAELVLPVAAEDLVDAADRLLTRASGQALFGADLTAVVTGPPSPALAELLDGSADRESSDAASIWRFGRASVRRALDAGRTAPGLVAELTEVAQGALPQPLVFMIEDVGRRHGEMQVEALACCVVCEQPTLLAEAAADRRLSALRPRLLAPTVLASALPVDQTLQALRQAGYYPVAAQQVAAGARGAPQRPAGQPGRAAQSAARTTQARRRGSATPDLTEVARRLLRSGRTGTTRPRR